ncbi:MAG: hypothetical protein ACXWUP_04230 [Allosphingosinicella sp.]
MTELQTTPPTASIAEPPSLTLRRKRLEDTAAGCRSFAAADMQRAEALTGEHIRWRYQHSAGAWLARAELLERLEAKFQARVRQEAGSA